MNSKIDIEQVSVSDSIGDNSNDNSIVYSLLIAALSITLPIYILILFLFDDSILRNAGIISGQNQGKNIEIQTLGSMNFAPTKIQRIKNQEELLKSILFTVDLSSKPRKKELYLRVGSFDTFTENSMKSTSKYKISKEWPEFAFGKLPEESKIKINKAYTNFFVNFEPRLPYSPILKNLAGPLNFITTKEGSVIFDYTIAVGDEFETEFLDSINFTANDKVVHLEKGSPYLSLYPLSRRKIVQFANSIVSGLQQNLDNASFLQTTELLDDYQKQDNAQLSDSSISSFQMINRFVSYLEQNYTYTTNFKVINDIHPVEEFLLKGHKGYCQHFTAGLLALCRAKGIPCRVGVGFLSQFRRKNKYLITKGMAHAWVEILTNSGWKIIDIKPQKSDMKPLIAANLSFPSDKELKKLLKINKRQKRISESQYTATRKKNKKYEKQKFQKPKPPGSVIKNKKKLQDFLKKQRDKTLSRLFKSIAVLIATLILAWFSYKYFDKFITWFLKLLRGKTKRTEENTILEKEARELLLKFQSANEITITGKNLEDLFHQFSNFMSMKGYERKEHETPGEYFNRLCEELALRRRDGKKASEFLESEIYGQRKISKDSYQEFLNILKQLIGKFH